MATGGDQESGEESPSREERPQDPLVERLRPDPAEPPQRVITHSGLLGNSDRPGYQRLYFNRALDHYAEFRTDDVVHTEPIPPDQPPFLGEQATRVTLKRDATIDYTRSRRARPLDEFDLDIRLWPRVAPGQPPVPFTEPWCPETEVCPTEGCGTLVTCRCGDTVQITICRGRTCVDVCTDDTCRTDCGQATCDTCQTRCGQDTCVTCQTCQTQCGQATCATCQTRCGQETCQTCQTRCGQETCRTCETQCGATCGTCDTCNPHINTCGRQCA